jgi:hypothetical protein
MKVVFEHRLWIRHEQYDSEWVYRLELDFLTNTFAAIEIENISSAMPPVDDEYGRKTLSGAWQISTRSSNTVQIQFTPVRFYDEFESEELDLLSFESCEILREGDKFQAFNFVGEWFTNKTLEYNRVDDYCAKCGNFLRFYNRSAVFTHCNTLIPRQSKRHALIALFGGHTLLSNTFQKAKINQLCDVTIVT